MTEHPTQSSSDKSRFDRFNDQAKHALMSAQSVAVDHHTNYVGTEHILLGLLVDQSNIASAILRRIRVDYLKIQTGLEFILERAEQIPSASIGLTPRAKKVIELAVDEAMQMHSDYIGTEHLLLGLLREGQGVASGVLSSHGATLEKAREATKVELDMLPGQGTPDQDR